MLHNKYICGTILLQSEYIRPPQMYGHAGKRSVNNITTRRTDDLQEVPPEWQKGCMSERRVIQGRKLYVDAEENMQIRLSRGATAGDTLSGRGAMASAEASVVASVGATVATGMADRMWSDCYSHLRPHRRPLRETLWPHARSCLALQHHSDRRCVQTSRHSARGAA